MCAPRGGAVSDAFKIANGRCEEVCVGAREFSSWRQFTQSSPQLVWRGNNVRQLCACRCSTREAYRRAAHRWCVSVCLS